MKISHMNRLITIPISHYCEKARWALEHAKIPYTEERHLQGFHFKHDTAPVLMTPDGVFSDSTDILKWCDSKASEDDKLYPVEPSLRKEIEDVEDYLDEDFGVAGRLWMYTYTLDDISLIVKYSKTHKVPWYEAFILPLVFPFLKKKIHRVVKLTPTSREDSHKNVDRVFNEVGQILSDGRQFLFGDRFTAADLTFAALSASVLIPEDYGVQLPRLDELPSEMAKQVKVWREHPAGQFALRMFREYR